MNEKQLKRIADVLNIDIYEINDEIFLQDQSGKEYLLSRLELVNTVNDFISILPMHTNLDLDVIFEILKQEKILPLLCTEDLVIRKLRKLGYKKVKKYNKDNIEAQISNKKFDIFNKSDFLEILKEEELENKDIYNLLLSVQKKNRGDCYY